MIADRKILGGVIGALLLIIASDIIPVLYVIRLSLVSVRGTMGGAYPGILRDSLFIRSLWNTAVFAVGAATLQVIAGLAVAKSMRHVSRAAHVAWFTVLLAPWLMSEVASVVLWRSILMADVGHLDRWMRALGFPALRLLAGSTTAMPTIIIVASWQGIGFTAFFLLGALTGIPANLYRASLVFGLTKWKTFLRLELPLLKTTLVAVWVAVALHSAGQFALPARLTMGGPVHATNMASLYLFDRLLSDPKPAIAAAGGSIILAGVALLCAIGWGFRRQAATTP